MRNPLLAAVLLSVSVVSGAHATIIEGTFSGVVYAASPELPANGSVPALDLRSLIGLPIFGTFSYDSKALPLASGGSGTCCSTFSASQSASPMIISIAVGRRCGPTFTVTGTGFSTLVVNTVSGQNFFHAATQNVVGGPSPVDVERGDSIGEITFELLNPYAPQFLSDGNDAGTVSFEFLPQAFVFPGNGAVTLINDARNPAVGNLDFYVGYAAAHPVVSGEHHKETKPSKGHEHGNCASDDR
jgi:hypothetical protein